MEYKDGVLRVAGVVNDSITDGPGLRFALFLQGCLRGCPGCHNPQTWDVEGGSDMERGEVLAAVKKNPLLSGVTLSGGEPLLQAKNLFPLARDIKALGLEVALYTGDTFENILQRGDEDELSLLGFCDVMVDGAFILERRNISLRFRGSDNQRILDVKKSLACGQAVLSQDERWVGP